MYSLFWYAIWVNLIGVFVVMKVPLAQVEDGYLASKMKNDFDFITKKLEDPLYHKGDKTEHILHSSLTIPEAMKRLNLQLKTQAARRDESVQMQIRGLRDEHPDTARQLKHLTNIVQIQEYSSMQTRVKSKRNLLNMLSFEEMEWHERTRNQAYSLKKESFVRSSFMGGKSSFLGKSGRV